jgi:hypothetical protein
MVSGVSRNVVKIRLIRLGSCRSTIELRPQNFDLIHVFSFGRLSMPAKSLPTLHHFDPPGRRYRPRQRRVQTVYSLSGLRLRMSAYRGRSEVVGGVQNDAIDPSATLAVHRGNDFDCCFGPYQSTRLSR